MKSALMIIVLSASLAAALDGPDFMLYSDIYATNGYSINLFSFAGENNCLVQAEFQHASLYGLNQLNWNLAAAKYANGRWNLAGVFRSYGIDDMYINSYFALHFSRRLFDIASIGIAFEREDRTYGDNLYSDSDNSLATHAGIKYDSFNFDLTAARILFKEKKYYPHNPEIIGSVSWQADKALLIFGQYYRNQNGHDRFLIGQDLKVNEFLMIKAGLLSAPEVYYAGFEIVYKRFAIGYTFYDISALPNCSKFTLTYR